MRPLALVLLFALSGCRVLQDPSSFAKVALPVNVAAGWLTAVSLHEAGHAAAAAQLGAESIDLDVLPCRDEDGRLHMGLTTASFEREPSPGEQAAFHVAGPAASFLTHVSFGELNRSGVAPRHLQPTLGWIDLGSALSVYVHAAYGLTRRRGTDLGETDLAYTAALLVCQLAYDVWRIAGSEGGLEKYFKVLFGEAFYDPPPEEE